ncbi:MAG: glycosyltransferase family 39 protein [Blastocatellia bacterium]|nr:glycosyltransferase family 39 protein [Blastocatellia bacterium]
MNKRIWLTTFLLSTVVRLVTCWNSLLHPEAAWCPDATGYHELAAALRQGQFPSLFRTPGYPLFLALTGATSSDHVVFALLVQILLDALTAILLAAIARRLFESDSAALLTGLLYALCPVMAGLCGYIVSEPLAIFLVTAAIFLMLYQRSGLTWLAQAALWYAAVMVRPSYALLPLVASVFFVWQPRFTVTLKRQVLVLSLYAVLTGAWIGFNYVRTGVPTLSSNPNVSFYIYDTAAVRMVEQISLSGYIRLALLNPPEFDQQLELHQIAYAREAQASLNSPAQDLWFTKDNPALFRTLQAEAIQKLEGRWPTLIAIHLTGVFQSLRPRWNSVGWFFRVLDGSRMLLLPLAVGVLLWRRQWWFLTFFVVWAVYALLPPGPVGAWRFRSLIEPFISLTLASSLMIAFQWVQQQKPRLWLNLESSSGTQPQPEL